MAIEQEKIIASDNNAFAFRTLTCRHFPSPLHFHPEMEIVYINQGEGICFAAGGVISFQAGDIFFFGANMSHYFRSAERFYASTSKELCGSTFVQFNEQILPSAYKLMPGCNNIAKLIEEGSYGIKWSRGGISQKFADQIVSMEYTDGFDRMSRLYSLLNELGMVIGKGEHIASMKSSSDSLSSDYIYRRVTEYISLHFRDNITLLEIANYVNMNGSALCRHFKSKAGKSIFNYLLDYRIDYAKELLTSNDTLISEVAYSSGFSSIPNFNVQFKRVTGVSPSQYRQERV